MEEAIMDAKAGGLASRPRDFSPQITVDAPILIPEEYVPDLDLRMALYRRLNELDEKRELEAFAAEMLPVVVSLQHADQHLGKVPRRASVRMRTSVEQARLRRELDQAVAAENYELAAKLRDQIKALPEEGGPP